MQQRGLIISQILVPPINMRTPYDIEWDSKLQFQYNQLVNIIKIYFEKYLNEYMRRNNMQYYTSAELELVLQHNAILEMIKKDNTNISFGQAHFGPEQILFNFNGEQSTINKWDITEILVNFSMKLYFKV